MKRIKTISTSIVVLLLLLSIIFSLVACTGDAIKNNGSKTTEDFALTKNNTTKEGNNDLTDETILTGTDENNTSEAVTPIKFESTDLTEDIKSNSVEGKDADETFINSQADFSVELFKKSIDKDKNSLVSPLSVMLALSMTANGADDNTLSQMEEVLGGSLKIDDLNKYLYSYSKRLRNTESLKLNIANSIWFRDNESAISVNKDFLQRNADFYGASAYKSAFDEQTVKDINAWVNDKTDGLIDKIIDKIDESTVMYLINAIVFDAEWESVYYDEDIKAGEFALLDGTKRTVQMMHSTESKYIKDKKATGFIKNYKNGFSFVALLPNKDVSINDYISSMSGKSFLSMIKGAKEESVIAQLPKFSYDYSIIMNDVLMSLGMKDAFSIADANFTKLGSSDMGNLFISSVLHKTFISVDELGTKAGAVTVVSIGAGCAAPTNYKYVTLNRPFIYAIIDNTTNLPVFIGTVMDIQS